MIYHNYTAIIGRIPFDDEDSCYVYEHMTREQALQHFEDDIYADSGLTTKDKKRNEKSEGVAVYINHILFSESKIEMN